MIELGYPGFMTGAWYCVVTRSGAPASVISRLNRDINKVLQLPTVRTPLEADGVTVEGNMTSAELGKFIGDEMRKWAKIIKDANIQLE